MDALADTLFAAEHLWTVYFILFFAGFLENIMPPLPGDTVMLFGAYLVARQLLDLRLVYIATTCGSAAGFLVLFLAAKHLGRSFFLKKDYRFFSARSIQRAEDVLGRIGYLGVLVNRFIPGIRGVISIGAGLIRLNTYAVALLSLVSAGVWNTVWIFAGHTLGKNWDTVRDTGTKMLRGYNLLAGVIVVLSVVVSVVVYRIIQRNDG